jgi:copper chaperone NosL
MVLASVAGAACGGDIGPPRIELDRSACDRCGMLISEPRFAAAYRAGSRSAVFDDVGCLLDALDEENSAGSAASVWFLDEEEEFRTAAEVVFVQSDDLATPMNGGIQALARRADAEAVAAAVGGSIVESFAELRAQSRGARRQAERSHEPSH